MMKTKISKDKGNYFISIGLPEVPLKGDFDYENFPSKLGGLPVWLIPPDVEDYFFQCSECTKSLYFLMQIYCPLEENLNAFHRVLYIFFCKDCWKKTNAVKVLRVQLPEKSEFYSGEQLLTNLGTDEQIGNINKKLNFLLPEYIIDSCEEKAAASRIYMKFYDKIDEMSAKSNMSFDDSDEELEEDDLLPDGKDENVEKMIKKYCEENGVKIELINGDEEDDIEGEFIEKISKGHGGRLDTDIFYDVFSKVLSYDPRQVMRYCRDDVIPLWFSRKEMFTLKNIKCKKCKGEVIFEMQIMPHIFNLYKEILNIDIGTIVIYTCKKSCNSNNKTKTIYYMEEHGFLQRTGEKILELGGKNTINNLSNNLGGSENTCTLSREEIIKNLSKVCIKGNENNEPDEDGWVEVKKKKKTNDKDKEDGKDK